MCHSKGLIIKKEGKRYWDNYLMTFLIKTENGRNYFFRDGRWIIRRVDESSEYLRVVDDEPDMSKLNFVHISCNDEGNWSFKNAKGEEM